jgi:N6-L-threonylcarbamoyladenine synthase
MRLLAVESSCDDTAAAVLEDGAVRSSVVASQDDVHSEYGGVVPELASRSHIRAITPTIARALADAGATLDDIDAVAATFGPGLVGSLLVGLCAAKAIAYARHLPFIGVNHLEGHLLSVQLERRVDFPYVALLVSGGHTTLYLRGRWANTSCSVRPATTPPARHSTRSPSSSASATRAAASSTRSRRRAIRPPSGSRARG